MTAPHSTSLMPGRIHLVEPTGYSGIFHHTVALAEALASTGERVVLHTAREHEALPEDGFSYCRCGRWPQRSPATTRQRMRLARHFLGPMLNHLEAVVTPHDVVHLQGSLRGAFALLVVHRLRGAGARVVFSPHETFSRRGRLDGVLLRSALRRAADVITFSEHDVRDLARHGVPARISPLVMKTPPPDPTLVRAWRTRWAAEVGGEVVLFAGEIRGDKRLDTLIEAAADWPSHRTLAVVGRDRNAWAHAAGLASRLGVSVKATLGYVELEDFVAALAAADVVALPYDEANQSGVAAVARQIGARTVGSAVGGLPELVDAAFPPGRVDELNAELERVLARPPAEPHAPDAVALVEAHAPAYLLDAEPDWAGRAIRAQVA